MARFFQDALGGLVRDDRLETFDGSQPSKWFDWHNMFIQQVHLRTNITDVDKMMILKTKVKGKAAKILAKYPMGSVQYKQALCALRGE